MNLPDPIEKPEVFTALVARRQAKGLPALPGRPVPEDRHLAMLRLRLCEGYSLREVGEQTGVSAERVRQLLAVYFDLSATPRVRRVRF